MDAPAPHKLVFIGKVTRPHGVRGEVKVQVGEGSGEAWFEARVVWLGRAPESARPFPVRRSRPGGRQAILALEGVDSVEAAEGLRDQKLFVAREDLSALEDGEFYVEDLLGLRVEDASGRLLGRLTAVFDNGAHEVYAVGSGQAEILLPVVDGVVLRVEPEAGRIVVAPPAGLPGLD
jgi:16S rRNA processing protein RimM